MDLEVCRLVKAMADGDFLSYFPLSDRLKEIGDDRFKSLHFTLGTLLSKIHVFDNNIKDPYLELANQRRAHEFTSNLRALFWSELLPDGGVSALEHATTLHANYEEHLKYVRSRPAVIMDSSVDCEAGEYGMSSPIGRVVATTEQTVTINPITLPETQNDRRPSIG